MRFGAPIPAVAAPAGTAPPPPATPATGRAGGDGDAPAPSGPPDLAQTVAVHLVASAAGPVRRAGGRLEWTCRACATVNPIDEMACRACGGSMVELFRPPEPARPTRDPALAAWLSALPGLGTWYAGQPAQGVARFLLWLWWLSTAALFWSRPEPVLLLVKVTFLLATVALWVLSGVDAHRLTARRRPLLGPRALAVAAAGLCLLLLAGLLATLGAARSGIGPAPGLPAGPGAPPGAPS
jgi:hypothetical protein